VEVLAWAAVLALVVVEVPASVAVLVGVEAALAAVPPVVAWAAVLAWAAALERRRSAAARVPGAEAESITRGQLPPVSRLGRGLEPAEDRRLVGGPPRTPGVAGKPGGPAPNRWGHWAEPLYAVRRGSAPGRESTGRL